MQTTVYDKWRAGTWLQGVFAESNFQATVLAGFFCKQIDHIIALEQVDILINGDVKQGPPTNMIKAMVPEP